jgi:hypothetical protein
MQQLPVQLVELRSVFGEILRPVQTPFSEKISPGVKLFCTHETDSANKRRIQRTPKPAIHESFEDIDRNTILAQEAVR